MSQFVVARVAAQLFNTPLLLVPDVAVAIASNLAERFGVEPMDGDAGTFEASRFRGTPVARREDGRTLYRAENGVAVIPVMGELVNRGAWIGASSGLTSYEGLTEQLRAAAADPSVTGILLDMNSPGGEASGAIETGALVRSIAADKPVVAFVNGLAASAGYAIASGATKIVTTPSGGVGSIGVVFLHLDRSGALAKAGVKPTLIHAGAFKVDGSSARALPDDARERIQGAVDGLYELFAGAVAGNRKISADAVRATEGGVLMGRAAVEAGLADKMGTFDDALALLKPKTSLNGAFAMSDTISKAEHDAALKALTDKHAVALAEGVAKAGSDAVAADRARTAAILGHAEAKGREEQARHLAYATEMSVDQAAAVLKAGPKVEAQAPAGKGPRLGVPDPKIEAGSDETRAPSAGASWEAVGKELGAIR